MRNPKQVIAEFEAAEFATQAQVIAYSRALEASGREDSAYRVIRQLYAANPSDDAAVQVLSAACRLSIRDDTIGRIRACNGGQLVAAALSELDLIDGRYADGYATCDARWSVAKGGRLRDTLPGRTWRGETDGPLVVLAEQGIGEEILFAAALDSIRPATVACDPRLVPLIQRSFPAHSVIDRAALATTDSHYLIEGMSLYARQCRTSNPAPWLIPDPERVAYYRRQLADALPGRRVVGLAWASRRAGLSDAKNVPAEAIAPLIADPSVACVSLQYGDVRADLDRWHELGLTVYAIDTLDTTDDLDGVAALAAACDSVVTASCAVAHLAGAIGAPTHVLLPGSRFVLWYWGRDGDRTPFYPTTTLHRARPDWSAAVAFVKSKIDI